MLSSGLVSSLSLCIEGPQKCVEATLPFVFSITLDFLAPVICFMTVLLTELYHADTFMSKTARLYQDTRTANAAGSNLNKLNDELQDVTRIMTKNMEELLWRGDSLDSTRLLFPCAEHASDVRFLTQKCHIYRLRFARSQRSIAKPHGTSTFRQCSDNMPLWALWLSYSLSSSGGNSYNSGGSEDDRTLYRCDAYLPFLYCCMYIFSASLTCFLTMYSHV